MRMVSLACSTLLTIALTSFGGLAHAQTAKPNILFIASDGDTAISAPMARRGAGFADAQYRSVGHDGVTFFSFYAQPRTS